MIYAKKIRDFLVRKKNDSGSSNVNLPNFHPQMYSVLAAQGIFFARRDSYLRFVIPFISTGITIVGFVLQSLTIYMGVVTLDYSLACECFCYIMMICSIITIYIGILMNKNEILTQVEEMEADFKLVCSLGPRYREPFLESQLLVWMLFVVWYAIVFMIAGLFISYPVVLLLYQSLIFNQDEHTRRPLVFPLWLPADDPYQTPNYEMFFVLETVYCFLFTLTFGGYVYTLFHFLLHCYIMMDMIILDFKFIFEGLDETVAILPKNNPRRVAVQLELNKRLKRIVTWHLSVHKALKTVSSVFRPPLVYLVMSSSVILCLIVYHIADTLDNGGFDLLFAMLGIGCVLQLWIPCYLGTILRNKGFAVGDACWSCGWHETLLGRMIHSDIIIIIMRAQMPIFIKYTGQPVIQLETFTAIISTSYSYFNMLRQSAK